MNSLTVLTLVLDRIETDAVENARSQLETTEARAVLLRGGKKAFCTGLDLDAFGSRNPADVVDVKDQLRRFGELLDQIRAFPGPVIAAVEGDVLGGGLGLLGAADLVIANARAKFSLPETVVGLCPAVILPFVAERIGARRARLLALGHRPLNACEAVAWGLADHTTDDVEASVERHLRRLARCDSRAVAASKRLPVCSTHREEAIAAFADLFTSQQTQTRIARFVSGEAPWDEDAS